jgi:CheY-like chemotaxis protein
MAKILVIDDEPGMLDLLNHVLQRRGHEVVLGEGRKGLFLFQREHPQATILDLKMFDMDGLDVLREIRALDPNALVIIHTGFATEERERQARELGVTEFLQKDFSLHAVGAVLDRVLKLSDGRRQSPRLWVHFPISLLQEGAMIGAGTGFDLSAGGCTVESRATVGKGDHMALQLYLPDHHLPDHQDRTTPLMVEVAVVRWVSQQKCGLEFISLASGDQQRLHQYVTTLQTTSLESCVDGT